MIAASALIAGTLAIPDVPRPAPPPVLAPYIHGQVFEPGDYGWMRGQFADATPAEAGQWVAVSGWLERCQQAGAVRVKAALAAAGVADPALRYSTYGDPLCGAVTTALPQGTWGKDWPRFQATLARARRIAETLVWSASLAQSVADGGGDALPEQLNARPMTDQVLRLSLSWNAGTHKGAPPLDPEEEGMVRSLTWLAIRARDEANTAWLKAEVAAHGWPTIPKVGKAAAANAWLMVQHADDDPPFQLAMLRLMEPLATRGEVARDNHALLYDRVMLKIVGTQRYGTQWSCESGRWAPSPLEDAKTVETWRRSAGMGTLAENGARIAQNYGPCPPVGKTS